MLLFSRIFDVVHHRIYFHHFHVVQSGGAKDFSDLIDKMELVKSLANSDKELISEIQTKAFGRAQHQEEIPEADKKDLELSRRH